MALLISVFVVGWIAAAALGTQAYFRGEQLKAIHERNWDSDQFETLAQMVTGRTVDYQTRTHAFGQMDSYASSTLTNA